MSGVVFEVLGPVRLRSADGMVAPAGRLQRILLGVLLARANEPVPVDVLADALWRGELVVRATQKVQFHVHKLRRVLDDPGRLEFEPSGYRLRVRPGELDAERFASLVDAATTGTDPARRADLLREALWHWRGTPFEGLDVPLLADEAGRLAERRLAALELRFEAELDLGSHAAAVPGLSALVREHPLRERLVALLMTALHRDGRQAEALDVYRGTRRRLVDELGLEPGPALRAVEQWVLSGEPDGALGRQVPAQLPHNVRGFVGRDAELSGLDALLDGARDAPVTAVVAGTAGVGKTALTVRWAHRVRDRFPDGQLYVDLRGYGPDDPVSPEDALAGFLRALGVDGGGVPQDLDERSARFRSLVDGKKLLVVLDNARTVEQVRPLLAGTSTVVVVVTSRDMLAGLVARDGAERLVVDRLPVVESVALLRSLAGGRLDTVVGAAAALADLCARLPLALRIAAELVRVRAGSSIAELLTELTDENRRLDLLGLDGDPHSAVRAAFAWSYQHLPQPAARLFRLLGVHPGHDIDAVALAALGGDTVRASAQALAALARAHLVDEVDQGRYQPHDLLRAYAAELAETDPERDAARTRLFRYYVHGAARAMDVHMPSGKDLRPVVPTPDGVVAGFADEAAARRWLDVERANLRAVAVHAPEGNALALSRILWRYFETGGYIEDGAVVHALAHTVARDRGDLAGQADGLRFLSLTYRRLLRTADAEAAGEAALVLYTEIGDLYGQAAVQNNLAAMYSVACRYRAAIPRYERTLELFDLMGRPRPAPTLTNLGAIHRFVGDQERALDLVLQGIAEAEATEDRVSHAYGVHHLAVLYEYTGDYGTAREHAEHALRMARELGIHVLVAEITNQLGNVYRGLGDLAAAFRCHREALATARLNENDDLAAQASNSTGETHLAAGDAEAARRHHRAALTSASACDSPFETARALRGLGDACARLGDLAAARTHWTRARAIFADLGTPEQDAMDTRLRAAGGQPAVTGSARS